MNWAVRNDVGECGPAINFNVFKWLHNIQMKKFFNTVKRTEPRLGEHGPTTNSNLFKKASYHPDDKLLQHREMNGTMFKVPRAAVHLNVLESLHNINTKRFFNAAKWAGPWQEMWGSAAQPITWMFLSGCITSRLISSSTPWKKLGRVWKNTAQRKFTSFWKPSYHPNENILQHREMSRTVFGRARPIV